MDRLKTFGKYALLVIAFYIFSTIVAALYIQTTYETMAVNTNKNDSITVNVDEAKSTFVNGYVTGNITNNTNSNIQGKYVKIDLISKRGNKILTKYVQVDELKTGETRNFTINFQAESIAQANISVTDEFVQEETNTQLINLADAENEEIKGISIILSILVLAKYFFI